MTDAERKMWRVLRNRRLAGFKFRRQVQAGPFYLDFACLDIMLAIEVDGGQHNGSLHDVKRTNFLEQQGWQVLRFWNNEVLGQEEAVLEKIILALTNSPHPNPLPQAGEGNMIAV